MVCAIDFQSRNSKPEEIGVHIHLENAVHNAPVTFPQICINDAPVVLLRYELSNGITEKGIEKENSMNESESIEHIKAKIRIKNIALEFGMVACNEAAFPCWSDYHDHPVVYFADVYIYDPRSKRYIIQEIHGYKGHNSSYTYFKDRSRRIDDIQSLWGMNIEFPPPIDLDSLTKSTPLDILKSMGFDA